MSDLEGAGEGTRLVALCLSFAFTFPSLSLTFMSNLLLLSPTHSLKYSNEGLRSLKTYL